MRKCKALGACLIISVTKLTARYLQCNMPFTHIYTCMYQEPHDLFTRKLGFVHVQQPNGPRNHFRRFSLFLDSYLLRVHPVTLSLVQYVWSCVYHVLQWDDQYLNLWLHTRNHYSKTCLERALLRETTGLERPLVGQKLLHSYKWTCHQRPPVLTLQRPNFCGQTVAFQDRLRFHCIITNQILIQWNLTWQACTIP